MTTPTDLDAVLPGSFTLDEALGAGMTIDQVRYRLDAGRWEYVGRGSDRRADWVASEEDPFERRRRDHAHRAIAAGRRNRGAVVGYESAALVHGLPLWSAPPDYLTLVVAPTLWSGRRNRLVLRQLELPAEDVLAHDVPITTPARTWVDIARTRDLADALAAGDAGLRAGLFDKDALWSALRRAEGSRGCARAAEAGRHLDEARESPGESASSVRSTGWASTTRRLTSTRKKRREDEIRALGEQVVRWGGEDLRTPDLARRLRDLVDA